MVKTGNYLFLFGADAEYCRPIALRFDVKTDTWLDLKSLPYAASTYTATALLKGKIYLLGGMHITEGSKNDVKSNKFLASFSQYSIETNSWLKLRNLPKPSAYHSAASCKSYLFCAGGYTTNSTLTDRFYAYDTMGKIWLSKASMNCKRAVFSLEVLGAKLVACGGMRTLNVEIYDIEDDQWTLIQNEVLKHNLYPATVVSNGSVYIIGGLVSVDSGTTVNTDDVSIVDVAKSTIRRVSRLPFKVGNLSCALLTVPNKAPRHTLEHE